MIIRIWRICRICRPLETGWRKDRCNASGTNFKRNLACFQSTLFILQSFCNHLSLLQNHFIDLLLNHHKITELRTLTFYQFIAFYLSHVQFVTATIAFVNTLLNQALWISLMTLLINNQNLYFFSSANQCPSGGSTHGERAWGCKEKAYHGQSKKISNWLRAVWTVWVSLICEIQICMGLRIFIYFVHGAFL